MGAPSYLARTSLHPLDGSHPFTPVSVTGAYPARPGDEVICDTTGGTFAVTLPSSPPDGTEIIVKWNASTTPTSSPPTINTGGSDVFDAAGGVTSVTMAVRSEVRTLRYIDATNVWLNHSSVAPSLLANILTALPGAWTNIPLASGISAATASGDYTPATRLRGADTVEMSGAMTLSTTTSGLTIATLASAFRPATKEAVLSVNGVLSTLLLTPVTLGVATNGVVTAVYNGGTLISIPFDGQSYRIA